jgi:CheY-like chemotaxis protein
MSKEFDFISATDKPALIAFSTPEWLDATKAALEELGYKVHTAATHGDFLALYTRAHYDVVIVEELFCAGTIAENESLRSLQEMPMARRRHCTVMLLGDSFQTFNALQAFQQSVHAVINQSELFLIKQLIEKAIATNEQFLINLRETQARIFAGKGRE